MKKYILVVDDEEDIRDSIKNVLEKEGYGVVVAKDGKNALVILNKYKFDLIILDVMMPEMSGWDVMTEVLKTKSQYKNKILFLSVVEISDERLKELISKGAIGYMTKPFDITNLVTKIKEIVK